MSHIFWWYGQATGSLVLWTHEFKGSKFLRRVIRNRGFEIEFDRDFESVVEYCRIVWNQMVKLGIGLKRAR